MNAKSVQGGHPMTLTALQSLAPNEAHSGATPSTEVTAPDVNENRHPAEHGQMSPEVDTVTLPRVDDVWAALEATPGFSERVAAGNASLARRWHASPARRVIVTEMARGWRDRNGWCIHTAKTLHPANREIWQQCRAALLALRAVWYELRGIA